MSRLAFTAVVEALEVGNTRLAVEILLELIDGLDRARQTHRAPRPLPHLPARLRVAGTARPPPGHLHDLPSVGGMTDHRLLVVETELVSTFKVASRDGNTLSAVIRAAWDTGTLRTLTRHNPLTATGAHISIIGHITAEELRRNLDSTEAANGFGNRFLWLSVRRSKLLPDGGTLDPAELNPLVHQVAEALTFARRTGRLERDSEARDLWHHAYTELSEGEPGLVGSLLARAEAQVTRLSMLYALLDRCARIHEPHLRAALELWNYSDRSVRHLFGDSTGNPDADLIQRHLASNGALTRTEISNLFGRHASADRIDRAVAQIVGAGIATLKRTDSGGRPTERLISLSSLNSQPNDWPLPAANDAYHGLMGDIVRTVEPHTEADPVALLIQLLVSYGNAVGRTPYVAVEADRHYPNLFAVLVGDTAKARKGTSWGHARRVLCEADPGWGPRIMGGFSSGEGLIAQVADSETSGISRNKGAR